MTSYNIMSVRHSRNTKSALIRLWSDDVDQYGKTSKKMRFCSCLTQSSTLNKYCTLMPVNVDLLSGKTALQAKWNFCVRTTNTLTNNYKTGSVNLRDKYLQLHPLKVVHNQVENLGYSHALYSFAVTIDFLRLTCSIVSMILRMKRKITQGRCCGNGTHGFF